IKPGSTVSSISNTATVSAQSPAAATAPNTSDTASTTVTRSADLAVTKTATATANAGENVTYVITVHNNGPSDGVSATLTDTLSTELQGAKFCVDSGPACNPATGSSWTGTLAVGPLASGDTETIRILAQIKPGSTVSSISNTATVSAQSPTDPTASNNSDTASTTVTRSADLAVTKTATATANAGENVTYVITVHNNGPSDGVSATLTDTLSTELQGAKFCVDSGPACNPATGSSWTGT